MEMLRNVLEVTISDMTRATHKATVFPTDNLQSKHSCDLRPPGDRSSSNTPSLGERKAHYRSATSPHGKSGHGAHYVCLVRKGD